MRIGEVAQRAGVSASRLRFYEAKGLLPPASRDANGYRTYEFRTVKIVGIIERAQNLGFSLKEIGVLLAMPPEQRKRPDAFIPHVEAKLREIDAHLREVQKRRRELRDLLVQLIAESESAKDIERPVMRNAPDLGPQASSGSHLGIPRQTGSGGKMIYHSRSAGFAVGGRCCGGLV